MRRGKTLQINKKTIRERAYSHSDHLRSITEVEFDVFESINVLLMLIVDEAAKKALREKRSKLMGKDFDEQLVIDRREYNKMRNKVEVAENIINSELDEME